jgi:hypothetical protein
MASFCFILSLCRLVVFREHILVFFRKFRIVSVRFETVLFVSVVSIKVRNTETNRKFFFSFFTKQTETNAKQILFRFVSVRFSNRKYFFIISRTPYESTSVPTDMPSVQDISIFNVVDSDHVGCATFLASGGQYSPCL